MQFKELVEEAFSTAKNNGFWDMEMRIETKFRNNTPLDDEEIQYCRKMFKVARIMHIVSECSEMYDCIREGREKHSPEELSDIIILAADYAGGYRVDIESSTKAKMEKNTKRDKLHGKKF